MRIFTLGTSNRRPYEFQKILNKHRIEVVMDVRRFPTSQYPHFKRENLKGLCESQGAEYIYLGNELGGYRKGGYENFTRTPEFRRGVELIKSLAQRRVCLILCAERFPGRCHRRHIADRLVKEGIGVVHILDEDRVWQPKGSE